MADDQRTPLRQDFSLDEQHEQEYDHPQEVEQANVVSHLEHLTEANEPATPPYRRDPSTSQLDVGGRMPPEYRSQYAASSVKLGRQAHAGDDDYPDEKASRRGKQTEGDDDYHTVGTASDDDHESTHYATASTHRKGVHYPDTDGDGPLHNATPKRGRVIEKHPSNEEPRTQSPRASSVASSDADDDDDEMYDWSDEGDLVDEEAKFEKKMGRDKTAKGWGLWRYA